MWGTARGEHVALIRELGATPIDYQREDFTRVLPGGFEDQGARADNTGSLNP